MTSTLREMIATQPSVLRAVASIDISASAERLRAARRIVIVGTGTSFHAAELGAYLLNSRGLQARAVRSSEFARWWPRLDVGDGAVVISHTGETAFARTAFEQALAARVPVVAITGEQAGWPNAIVTPCTERSETYTVSYTAALGVLGLLAHSLTGADTGPGALASIATEIEGVLGSEVLSEFGGSGRALALVGPGIWGVTAREGALKIREAAHILAEGFDSESLLHGAAVPYGPGDTLLAIASEADADGLTAGLVAAAREQGMTTHELPGLAAGGSSLAARVFLAQIPVTVRLQLLAAQLSQARGTDPDHAITGAWAEPTLWSSGAPTV